MNTLDEMEQSAEANNCACSTHIMLKSGSVKMFNLEATKDDGYIFGFTLLPTWQERVEIDEEGIRTVSVYIDRRGVDSLINFLDRLQEVVRHD